MEGVEPPEPGDYLPCAEDDLDAALGDAAPALIAKERRQRIQAFPPAKLLRG